MNRLPAANVALFWAIAVTGAGVDLITKWLAFTRVGEPSSTSKLVLWPGVFSFTTSYNQGALWGIGRTLQHSNLIFAALSAIAAVVILYWLFWQRAAKERLYAIALGLIMAGTVGNCYDRIVWKQVRDWIYFELINWPIFNIADSCLVCGAGVLVIQAIVTECRAYRTARNVAPANPAAAETSEP